MSQRARPDRRTRADLRLALRIVWGVLSVVALFAVVAPFAVPPEVFHRILPPCPSRTLLGKPCPTCGMTTAFLALSRGDWERARQANRFSIPLYLLLWVNEGAAIAFGLALLLGSRRPRGRRALAVSATSAAQGARECRC